MRVKDSIERLLYLHAASESSNIKTIYTGLDIFGSTLWSIDRPCLTSPFKFETLVKHWQTSH